MIRKKSWSWNWYKEDVMAKEIIFIDTETLTEEEQEVILQEEADGKTEG